MCLKSGVGPLQRAPARDGYPACVIGWLRLQKQCQAGAQPHTGRTEDDAVKLGAAEEAYDTVLRMACKISQG